MVHSDSSLMLAGASCTIELNKISDDSYTLDKSVEDITNAIQNLQLSCESERHLVPCSSCTMFLDMSHSQFLQCFPAPSYDVTGFICSQCIYKGELLLKVEELECEVKPLRAEKTGVNSLKWKILSINLLMI